MSGIDVSIIIVNYNTLDLTRECIDSVFSLTKGLSFEIILVDNASEDGSKEFFESDSRITYIYSTENLGFGKANNLGYNISKGNYIFLLNSDTYLINNAIYELWKAISSSDKENPIACIGCLLENAMGKLIHSFSSFPTKKKTILENTVYAVLNGFHLKNSDPSIESDVTLRRGEMIDVDYITGADLMISRDVIEDYGLFDPDFFMYCEESEMQYRYKNAGYRRVILGGPRIVHLVGKSNKSSSPQFRTTYLHSLFLYHKKTSKKIPYLVFVFFFKITYIPIYVMSFVFAKGTFAEKWRHLIHIALC